MSLYFYLSLWLIAKKLISISLLHKDLLELAKETFKGSSSPYLKKLSLKRILKAVGRKRGYILSIH